MHYYSNIANGHYPLLKIIRQSLYIIFSQVCFTMVPKYKLVVDFRWKQFYERIRKIILSVTYDEISIPI